MGEDFARKVGAVGLDPVGTPLAHRLSEAGRPIRGFDADDLRVQGLNKGTNPIKYISHERIVDMLYHLSPTAQNNHDTTCY